MRAFSIIVLGLVGSTLAAPAKPILSGRDPMSLHRRSIPEIAHSVFGLLSSSASSLSSRLSELVPASPGHVAVSAQAQDEYLEAYEDEITAWEDRHAQCAELCKVRTIEGARSGLEALCSLDGLQSTLSCAQCIDTTWPEDMFENTAMAEYDRIVRLCEAPQSKQLPL